MITLYEGIVTTTNPATFTGMPYPLIDAIDCTVTEERNGQFSLVVRYPIGAQYWEKIIPDAIIMAEPRKGADAEPFRIYEIEQVLDGIITARANHIVYDLCGIAPLSLSSITEDWTNLDDFITDINTLYFQYRNMSFRFANAGMTSTSTIEQYTNNDVQTLWGVIGYVANALGAELKYEWANGECVVSFCQSRGRVNDTIISYGINIVSLNRKLYTGDSYSLVCVYWIKNGVALYGYASTPYTGCDRTLLVNVTDKYENEPTQEEMDAEAANYVATHNFVPSSDLSVEFVPFENTTEYDDTPVSKLTDSTPYVSRTSGGSLTLGVRNRESDKVIGGTIAWNQLASLTSSDWATRRATFSSSGTTTSLTTTSSSSLKYVQFALTTNHVYHVRGKIIPPSSCDMLVRFANGTTSTVTYIADAPANTPLEFSTIGKNTYETGNLRLGLPTTAASGVTGSVEKLQVYDLTAMFGSTIANYLYTLESDTLGAGVAWLTSRGFFTADYYTRQTEKIESVQTSAHIMWDGSNNVIGNYALDSDLVLRGILKLDASNKLYYDGDEYSSDGTVIRKYAERAYTSGDATDGSTMITDGTTTVYKLGVSTTETADPFMNPQNVEAGGIEQYVDAGLANNTRTFSMPVGHETTYFYVSGVSGLELCDTATVDASIIGVTATAKCVKVVYNVLTKMYDTVTVGTLQNDIVDTILKLG